MENKLPDKIVKDSADIETLLIAEILSSPQEIPSVRRVLHIDSFAYDTMKETYKDILNKWDSGETVDIASVLVSINDDVKMKIIEALSSPEFSFSQMEAHANYINQLAQKRQLYKMGYDLIQKACSESSVDTILNKVETETKDIREQSSPREMGKDAYGCMEDYSKVLEEEEKLTLKGRPTRVSTGFAILDSILMGGFDKGNLVILAARPSVGKTALLLQIAENASRTGFPTYIFSLEMTNDQLAKRLMLSKGLLHSYDISRARIDWNAFTKTQDEYKNIPLFIDSKNETLEDIESVLTLASQQGRCKAAFIDYLQIIKGGDSRWSMNQLMSDRTSRLKRLAKRLGIPIILLSQLSRASAMDKREPQMHDLRDSGAIEQDADTILMLDRHDYGNDRGVDVFVRKNRNGKAGDIKVALIANESYTHFSEINENSSVQDIPPTKQTDVYGNIF